jgi:hypothetical protein
MIEAIGFIIGLYVIFRLGEVVFVDDENISNGRRIIALLFLIAVCILMLIMHYQANNTMNMITKSKL